MLTLPDRKTGGSAEQQVSYSAFGLRLDVDPRIDISGLSLAEQGSFSGKAHTSIKLDPEEVERRWGPVSGVARRMRELRDGDSVVLTVDLAGRAGYLLHAEGVGRMLVTADGTEVLCDPLADDFDWVFILAAQVLPLAATLGGLEVLHAAGLGVDGSAALFTGPPGAGKSSLAAALLLQGARLLSDDCVALQRLDGSLIAHPGAGILYLRQLEHDRLSDADRAPLGSPAPFGGKQRYEPKVATAPLPFGALFLLERAERGPAIEHVDEVDPFTLLAATFNLSVRTPDRLVRQLDMVEELVAADRVYRLRILPDTNATHLADGVAEHLDSISR
jgi:hypothetical protein